MKSLYLFFFLALTISLFQSCEKETIKGGDEAIAPELPPEDVFIMPFTSFEDADTTGFTANDQVNSFGPSGGPGTYRNWFFAASNLVIWNSVITLSTAIPMASFRAAFNHEPQFVSPGVFEWNYDHVVAGKTYAATLTGEVLNDEEVKWTMVISEENGWTDVEWYSGIVKRDHSSASWTLNHQPYNPESFLRIDCNRNTTDGAIDIRYTNIIPNHNNQGDYIEFRANDDSGLNRAYDVLREGGTNLLEIRWNSDTRSGRVKNENHFGDTDWHCWDSERKEIDCQ